MATHKYFAPKGREYVDKTINVVNLINRSKIEAKREKGKTLYIAALASILLILSILVIAL